jgi:saccharopine dehydrogenase-like NADP-dependent oxidoreductase
MSKIVVFGAGKSSSYLIKYLYEASIENNWQLLVCDQNTAHVAKRFDNNENLLLINLDITDSIVRQSVIAEASVVISLMPPHLHLLIAQDCVANRKHLITASYVSADMQALNQKAIDNGVMLMCELGLDPGIDHISAMQIIDELHADGAQITSFLSHCGGLVAPSSDNNPWHYKISWNPRNVVTAGAAGAEFLFDGQLMHQDYKEIFASDNTVEVDGLGILGYYANRDSVSYKAHYGLNHISTLVRTTLRYPQFIDAWNYVIQAGLTSTTDDISVYKTIKDWHSRVAANDASQMIQELLHFLFSDLSDELLLNCKTSADVLQKILEQKLAMQPEDKDMIVMKHEFAYNIGAKKYKRNSTLIVEGVDKTYTAMAKTVGLPMAIFAEQLLLQNIKPIVGVHIPTQKEIYELLMPLLAQNNITFKEEHYEIHS